MNLSILDKILLIIKYFISSFLGIELFFSSTSFICFFVT